MLKVRRAQASDSQQYLEWRNDPATVQASLVSTPVVQKDHEVWFERKLLDHDSLLLVAELDGSPCGQIRFDKDGERFLISYSIGRDFRGLGLSTQLLSQGIAECVNHFGMPLVIEGYVRVDNIPSHRAFARVGFQSLGEIDYQASRCVRYQIMF